jgi:MFS family permease
MWFVLYCNFHIVKEEIRVKKTLLNGIALGTSEIFACLFAGWLAEKLGRLGALTLFYTIGGVMCIISVAFTASNDDDDVKEISNVIYGIVLCICDFIIIGSVYINFMIALELFPTVVRAYAFGVLTAIGAIAALISPILVEALDYFSMNPLLITGIGTIICACIVCLLPETAGCDLLDYLSEEKEEMAKPMELSRMRLSGRES